MTDKDYGGWCTNWAAYDLPQLWSFLQYENPDPSFDQAGAWRKTAELIDYYRSELKMKRDELATKWPPERSPAAQVFVQYADELLSSMDKTAAQAYDNGQAVSGITLALADAKQKISDLNEQWQDYQQKEQSFVVSAAKVVHAGSLVGVPSDWQQQLKNEAATVMHATDTAVFQYTGQMQVPEQYEPKPGKGGGGTTPLSPGGTDSGVQGSAGVGGSSRAPAIPPPPPTPPGPVLAGGPPTATLPPPAGTLPVEPPVGRVLAPSTGPTVLPVFPGIPGGPGMPNGPVAPGRLVGPTIPGRLAEPGRLPVSGEPVPSRPSMPGKAFLGRGSLPTEGLPGRPGMPGVGEAVPHGAPVRPGEMPMAPMGGAGGRPNAASPRTGAAPGRRVNPVGGVVGGRGGESFTTKSGHMITIGPRRSRQDRSERRVGEQGFDPDNPWAVAVGVPPVIEPAPEPEHHDPGPGVIGIDR